MRFVKALLAASLVLPLSGAGVAVFAQPRTTPAPAQPIPMEVFARLPQTENPEISAKGSAVAAKIRSNGRQVLAVIPLDTPDARAGGAAGGGGEAAREGAPGAGGGPPGHAGCPAGGGRTRRGRQFRPARRPPGHRLGV